MKVTKKDIEASKTFGAKSKHNKEETKKTIELYKDRKIERFDTAKIIINGLSSKGPAKQQNAKHRLKFYEEEYIPRRETLNNPIPIGVNRFVKPKDILPEQLAKLTTGSTHSVKSYIMLKTIKDYPAHDDEDGGDMRSVMEYIHPHIERLEKHCINLSKLKKSG